MAVPVLHADQQFQNVMELSSVNKAIVLGLSNTLVAGADTNAGLQSAISGLSVHAEYRFALTQINRAVANSGDLGVANGTNILSLTTTAGLQALFPLASPGVPVASSYGAGLAYQ